MSSPAPMGALAARTDNNKATLWMVLSMAAFAVEDVFLKRAAVSMPPGQVLVINGLIGGMFFAIWAQKRGERVFSRDAFQGAPLLRNLSEGVATLLYMLVLAIAPLALASSILQATPLMVTAGAALFLGETVGWRRWASILTGFLGVLIILEPWKGGFDPAGIAMLASVVLLATRDLITRQMPIRYGTMSLSAWGMFAVVPAGLLLMYLRGEGFVMPGPANQINLAAALVTGVIGYYLVTQAMRMGEVAVVAPFRYTRLVFTVVLAMVFLGEKLTLGQSIGASIVVASGLYAFARERKRKATLSQTPTQG